MIAKTVLHSSQDNEDKVALSLYVKYLIIVKMFILTITDELPGEHSLRCIHNVHVQSTTNDSKL